MCDVANYLGYEYHYFSTVFRECFSVSFTDFVNLYKYELACEKLLDTTKPITLVAIECGFKSIRTFNRIFKKFNGITPSQFRQKNKEL